MKRHHTNSSDASKTNETTTVKSMAPEQKSNLERAQDQPLKMKNRRKIPSSQPANPPKKTRTKLRHFTFVKFTSREDGNSSGSEDGSDDTLTSESGDVKGASDRKKGKNPPAVKDRKNGDEKENRSVGVAPQERKRQAEQEDDDIDVEFKKPKKRDRNAPKRPMNPLLVFMKMNKEAYLQYFPGLTNSEVQEGLKSIWREMSAFEKQVYKDEFEKRKKQYVIDKAEYDKKKNAPQVVARKGSSSRISVTASSSSASSRRNAVGCSVDTPDTRITPSASGPRLVSSEWVPITYASMPLASSRVETSIESSDCQQAPNIGTRVVTGIPGTLTRNDPMLPGNSDPTYPTQLGLLIETALAELETTDGRPTASNGNEGSGRSAIEIYDDVSKVKSLRKGRSTYVSDFVFGNVVSPVDDQQL
ncbi:hypothetical protein HK102_001024 [Quaeritorhiza haematococci]|nr:hypothetical protein HK102_001024 [Quaeritorhiza haematococci]